MNTEMLIQAKQYCHGFDDKHLNFITEISDLHSWNFARFFSFFISSNSITEFWGYIPKILDVHPQNFEFTYISRVLDLKPQNFEFKGPELRINEYIPRILDLHRNIFFLPISLDNIRGSLEWHDISRILGFPKNVCIYIPRIFGLISPETFGSTSPKDFELISQETFGLTSPEIWIFISGISELTSPETLD